MTRVAVSDNPIKNTSTVEHSPAGGWPAFSSVESVAGTSDMFAVLRLNEVCRHKWGQWNSLLEKCQWLLRGDTVTWQVLDQLSGGNGGGHVGNVTGC